MADVSTLIAQQTAAVDAIQAQADGFLQDLLDVTNVSFSDGFNIDTLLPLSYDYSSVPQIQFPVFNATRPVLNTTTTAPPSAPTSAFSTITTVDVPTLTATEPVLSFPATPSSELPTAPGAAPDFVSPDIPTAPVVSLPAVPTFAALALPTAPSINLPSFSGSLPVDDLLAPTVQFSFYEAAYSSILLDPLKVKLLDNLVNGGYGIDTADEVALFNRARDREVEAMLGRVEDAGRVMASRGFPLPPGELAIHFDRAYQEMQDKASSASRDITLERAKLFVENRQFTIQEVRQLEQALLGFHNSVQERALNVARYTVEMALAIFDSLVKRYTARLEAYKAEATVFEARVRAELVKAEIYRTEVEAASVQVQMNRQLVEVYLAQLKGIEISVDMYKTQMEAAAIRANIERIKLEAFKSQVDAYTAQVQAKVAEFGMYRAQIDGERAKVEAFGQQVSAFNGQVNASKVKSDVQLGKLQSETEQARVKLANFQGQLSAYEADIKRLLETGRLQVELYSADVASNRATTDGLISKAALQEKALEATVTQNIEISKMTIENVRAKLLASVEALKFRTAGVQYGSEKYYALLNSMVSTINTLAVQTATA